MPTPNEKVRELTGYAPWSGPWLSWNELEGIEEIPNATVMGSVSTTADFRILGAMTSIYVESARTFFRRELLRGSQVAPIKSTASGFESISKVWISCEPESPFDQLLDLRSDDDKLQELIVYTRLSLEVRFKERLADRLEFLCAAAKSEEPQINVSPESARHFLIFLQSIPNLNYPDVVLSPSGNIRAQWRVVNNNHFVVEFLPTSEVRFVMFVPHAARMVRLSGLVPVNTLMQTLEPYRILSWIGR